MCTHPIRIAREPVSDLAARTGSARAVSKITKKDTILDPREERGRE